MGEFRGLYIYLRHFSVRCYAFTMTRIARVIYPHHITQRGNHRQIVLFCDEDYRWSRIRAHFSGQDDNLVQVTPLLDLISDRKSLVQLSPVEEVLARILKGKSLDRRLSMNSFVYCLQNAKESS